MAERSHCYFCFDVLAASLSRPSRQHLSLSTIDRLVRERDFANGERDLDESSPPQGRPVNGENNEPQIEAPARPLFVTWNILKSGTKHLRGCIGTFEHQKLEDGLKNYALTSAFDDTRFNPIEPKEICQLECGRCSVTYHQIASVSILTDFEAASNPMDWVLGVHGLRISFVYHHRRLGATYLPDVPVEQGWSKEETIISLMRKAGWSGRRNEWQKVDLNVTRYKGTKACIDYAEYKGLLDYKEHAALR